jgi:SAM-dependent methyltransferase
MGVASADQRPDGWDAVAPTYAQVLDPFTALYAEEALRLVPPEPGSRVLDVATGCGNLACLAAGRGADVLAIDFAPAMLARLRVRLAKTEGRVRPAIMDGQALALPDAAFDAAYSVFGLMFFPDRVRGLREMWRILKPGGRAVVAAWSSPERMAFLPLVRRAVQAAVPGWAPPARRPSWHDLGAPGAFEAEARAAGFREVTVHAVARPGTFPSADWLWSNMTGVSPVLSELLGSLAPESVAAAGRVFVAELQARFGGGSVTLPAEALLAVGRK